MPNKFSTFQLLSILSFLFIFQSELFAQKRIGIYNVSGISSKSKRYFNLDSQTGGVFGAVPAYCVDFFSNNPDFITIDRKNLSLINTEKELQKSENFMDGYVVEQGKSEGVDFICQSVYDVDTYNLIIKILDVKEQKVLCSNEKELDKNFWGIKNLKETVTAMLIDINSKCFESNIPFVRVIESKGKKAKTALIAAGSDLRLKVGYKIEFFKIVEEKIGSKTIKRKQVIASGEVNSIEDENFSIIEINDGQEELMLEVTNKTEVNCKLILK
jgi:hypothetical protein